MTKDDQIDVLVCVDCGFYLANGVAEDDEDHTATYAALDRNWKGYVIVNGDSDKDHEFSWSPCEGCGSKLGGARMHCVAWKCDEPAPSIPAL